MLPSVISSIWEYLTINSSTSFVNSSIKFMSEYITFSRCLWRRFRHVRRLPFYRPCRPIKKKFPRAYDYSLPPWLSLSVYITVCEVHVWKWILLDIIQIVFKILKSRTVKQVLQSDYQRTSKRLSKNGCSWAAVLIWNCSAKSKSNITVQWMSIGQPISHRHFYYLSN